jgi:mono/diheme cytochrome c family protein
MTMHSFSSKVGLALLPVLGILVTLTAFSAAQPQSKDRQPATQKHRSANDSAIQQSEGEKKFKQNCSRCHEAPQGFSSRISGTILRHMRVRALLSEQDERDILRFLNP